MKKPLGPLTAADIKVLRWAVSEAETWRGTMVGHADDPAAMAALDEFDGTIAQARLAVRKADALRKAQRKETT